MHAVSGSLLEISRSDDAAEFEWRVPGSNIESLEKIWWLFSPFLSFAGLKFQLLFERNDPFNDSSPLELALGRDGAPSPFPLLRYWLGAGKGDGGREEEEIGRGRMEPGDSGIASHPWLSLPEMRRRVGCSANSSGTLSVILRLRTGPETEDEMKSLVDREEPTTSREAAAEKFGKTDIEDMVILREHLKKLLLHASDHDVTLTVKEKKFKAHKNVLRVRSPVFEAMFTHQMRENEEDSVTIDDVDPDCFGAFLRYVYTGEVEDLSTANAMGLFYAADKYNFPALKRRCVEVFKASLSTTLVCDVISLAVTHGEKELLESAMAYVTEHLVHIMETVEWQRFATRNPIQANEVSLKAIKRRLNSNPQ